MRSGSLLDDMSQSDYERFQVAAEPGNHTSSVRELINLTENLDCYDIYPYIHDHEKLGQYYIEELDAMEVPENFASLPPDMIQKYTEQFKRPELFTSLNGQIVSVSVEPEKTAAHGGNDPGGRLWDD